jgi:hypothetical protein
MVSLLDTLGGAPMYRVRMDFTSTDALTLAMDLYWEFWLGGQLMGKREKVPQSAVALFAAEALDADMLDGRHAADLDNLYINESQAASITAGMIQDGAVGLSQLALECSTGESLVQTATGWQCASAAACIDGDFVGCYEGAAGTLNVGPCVDGVRSCSGGAWGTCVGQVTPAAETCDGVDNDCNGVVDDGVTCFDPAAGSAQILAARSAADGGVSLPITAYATYTKVLIGGDPAGFFVQAEAAGPALFVAVDPATLLPVPAPGDLVSFTVTTMGTLNSLRQATAISGYTVDSSGNSIAGLLQDVSAAADLVSALDSYESEFITLDGTVTGTFAVSGPDFVSAVIETAGVTGDANLRLRIPVTLQASLGIDQNCTFTLNGTPLWRFSTQAQPSAWAAGDISLNSCPAPQVTGATTPGATTVRVSFGRDIDPASVLANGSQFTFDGGLTALAAALVTASTVEVTTSSQTPGLGYTVTVAGTVTDTLGTGVDGAANSATFTGYDPSGAVLVINEVDYDQPSTDTDEFVEILNPTGSAVDLTNLALVLVNGGTGQDYSIIDLSAAGSLAAGDYLVVGSATVANVDIAFGAAANNIQNGPPDGVAIVNTATETVIDALSYEGEITVATITGFAAPVNLVEGTATAAVDASVDGSLSRCPDGLDTDDAANDWALSTAATPGAANSTCP